MSEDRSITKSAVTMRLVNTETYLSFDYSVGQTPPFAILSHHLISLLLLLLSLVRLIPLAIDIDHKCPSVLSDDSNQPSYLFPFGIRKYSLESSSTPN
jgi:hypothetical protein